VVGGVGEVDLFGAVDDLARSTPWLHAPAVWFATYGVAVFAALLLLAWLGARRDGDQRRVTAALWAPVGALVAIGVNQVVAAAVAEPRPFTVVPGALVLVHRSTDPSFPSDHAVMAGAVAAGVWLVDRRLGVVTAALALVMAATRVYVGAHFPLDVAAGLALGAAVALLSWGIVRPWCERLVGQLSRTPARPLVTARPADGSG
jgi:undecaprenyl-diphosphatase